MSEAVVVGKISQEGLEHIAYVMEQHKEEQRKARNFKPKNIRLSTFGIKCKDGYQNLIAWKIDGYRTDKRTGPCLIKPMDPYAKSLFEGMFRKWE